MGSYLDKPNRDKGVESGHGSNVRYMAMEMQGWRKE